MSSQPSWFHLGSIILPVMILLSVLALFVIIRIVSRCYIKVAPNEALVIFGRKYMSRDGRLLGFQIITGGAALCLPMIESYKRFKLDPFPVEILIRNFMTRDNWPININASATLRIGREQQMLESAVRSFDCSNTQGIKDYAGGFLTNKLQDILAGKNLSEVKSGKDTLAALLQQNTAEKLMESGLILEDFKIEPISDELKSHAGN